MTDVTDVKEQSAAPSVPERARRRRRLPPIVPILLGALLILILTYTLPPFRNYQLATVGAYFTVTAGLTVLTGLNGQLSLGHGALLATGAPLQRFHISRSVLGRQTMHLIVPRSRAGAEALIERFNQGLATLRASGDYQRLIDSILTDDALVEVQPPEKVR